jgi:undecaprenyl-diphosphatase
MEARATPRRSTAATALHELAEVDLAVYRAIAGTPTPTLDRPLRRLSGLANHSLNDLADRPPRAIGDGTAQLRSLAGSYAERLAVAPV